MNIRNATIFIKNKRITFHPKVMCIGCVVKIDKVIIYPNAINEVDKDYVERLPVGLNQLVEEKIISGKYMNADETLIAQSIDLEEDFPPLGEGRRNVFRIGELIVKCSCPKGKEHCTNICDSQEEPIRLSRSRSLIKQEPRRLSRSRSPRKQEPGDRSRSRSPRRYEQRSIANC